MTKTSLDKAQIKFLLLEGIHPSALKVLRTAGYTQIESLSGALEGDELKAKIADAHFVGIRSRTQLTADVFAHAHKLTAVGCFCIGTNQVALTISGSELKMAAQDIDFSFEGNERMNCQYDGEDLQIAFNARFLIEMLNAAETNEVKIELATSTKAGIIKPTESDENEDLLMLVMPLMLNN